MLCVLDEPSIGLHPREYRRLLASLERLHDMGNTVVVVEHDRDTMEAADYLVDFGPGPGTAGVWLPPACDELAAAARSVTGVSRRARRASRFPPAARPIAPNEAALRRRAHAAHGVLLNEATYSDAQAALAPRRGWPLTRRRGGVR